MSDEDDNDNCGVCKKLVREEDNGIGCEVCHQWFHAGCTKMAAELYKMLKKYRSQPWFCKRCTADIKQIKQLKDRNEELKVKLKDLQERVEEKKLEIAEEAVERVVNKLPFERLTYEVTEKVMEQLGEKKEQEKRKNNIVLYKIPEPTSENAVEREQDDQGKCKDLFENSLGLEDRSYTIEKVIRLGKKREDGTVRPLLVKLKEENEKWTVLGKAKNLRLERNPQKRMIGISLDLTVKQRDEDKKLREELQRKRQDGETGWYIKNGKLCRAEMVRRETYRR